MRSRSARVIDIAIIMALFCPAVGFVLFQYVPDLIGGLFVMLQCFMVAVPLRMLHDTAACYRSCFRRSMLGLAIFVTGIMIILYGLMSFKSEHSGLHVPDGVVSSLKPFVPFVIMANLMSCGIGVLLIRDTRNKGR